MTRREEKVKPPHGAGGPDKEPSPDRAMKDTAPFRDPAQRRLVEREVREQQNPMKTPPNHITSPGKGDFEAEPQAFENTGQGERDTIDP